MGFVVAFGICFGCKSNFSFNPMKVPSLTINGNREPFCRTCIERANPLRIKNGLAPIVPAPDAYAPCPEEELP